MRNQWRNGTELARVELDRERGAQVGPREAVLEEAPEPPGAQSGGLFPGGAKWELTPERVWRTLNDGAA